MALSATFTANFSSFFDAVDKANVKLTELGGGASRVGDRLDRMAQQFSGQKVIQEASLMAKAIGDVENYAHLTDKELARVAATAQEAVEKLGKLGQTVPKDIQLMADATKDANKASTDWMGTLTKVASAVGIAFSIDAIKNFIGSVLSAASAIKDMADAWGVSTTAAQQWASAAKTSGISAETVGKSIQFMTEKLSESSDEYDALLANIGLSGEKLRAGSIEDAFKQIIGAVEKVEDPMLRLDLLLGLIGPSARKMTGAIGDGFLELAAKQTVMTDETIKRLAAAEAQWKRYYDNVTIWSAEFLSTTLENLSTMFSSWDTFFTYLDKRMSDTPWTDTAGDFLKAKQAAAEYQASLDALARSMKPVASHGAAINPPLETTAQIYARLKREAEGARKAEEARTKATNDAAKAQEEINRKLDAATKANDDYLTKIRELGAAFSGNDLTGKAWEYVSALEHSIPIQEMTREKQDAINKVMLDAIGVYEAAGNTVPAVLREIANATTKIPDFMPKVNAKDFGSGSWSLPVEVELKPPKPSAFDKIATDLSGSLTKSILSAVQGGGSVMQAAGSTIGNYLLDPKQSGIGKSIETAAKKLPGLLGGAISSAIPVVGAFIGPAIGWLGNKIASIFGKKEHEKLRDSFVAALGGMEGLKASAMEAGVGLDRLFAARNTDQVKNAIADIQAAITADELRDGIVTAQGGLDAFTKAAELAGIELDKLFAAKSTEEVNAALAEVQAALDFQAKAYDALIEVTERYGFTIDELGPAMQRQKLDKQAQALYKDWEILNSAGIDTVAITKRMGDEVSAYVQDAKRMGREVPSEMRPMLESFARAGTLLDENGDAISDLEDSGISFAMTMSEGFQKLIDEVGKLTDAIARSLGLAIKNVPDLVVKGRVEWEETKVPTPPDGPDLESYQHGTDGFKNFGSGTPVMLHGWEAVVPRAESQALVAPGARVGSAAAGAPTVIVNAQGAFFDTPESLQRLATKVGDALTAKYSVMGKLRAAV